MSLPPSAEATLAGVASPASPIVRRTVRIGIWGASAEAHAHAMQAYASEQPGWEDRLVITAHELPLEASPQWLEHWLGEELASERANQPHLSLLVPTATASMHGELQLRQGLANAGLGFQVLYGETMVERLRNAANAIALTARSVLTRSESACFAVSDVAKPIHPRMRSWSCEKCSDPECEHRLFTGLVS